MAEPDTIDKRQPPSLPIPEKEYAALRSWYLARLRKSALEESIGGNLTPFALIRADRAVIERLIAEKTAEQSRGTQPRSKASSARHEAIVETGAGGILSLLDHVSLKKSAMAAGISLLLAQIVPIAALLLVAGLKLNNPEDVQLLKLLMAAAIIMCSLLAIAWSLLFYHAVGNRLARLRDIMTPIAQEVGAFGGTKAANELHAVEELCASLAKALEQAVERETAIADFATEVLISLDDSGTIMAASPSIVKLWGYQPEQLKRRPLIDIVYSEDADRTERAIATACGADGKAELESRITCLSGETKDMLWALEWSPTHRLLFCVAHDVTPQKEIERLKQEFLAMISHDLRTPLAAILGSIQLLEALLSKGEEKLNDRSRQLLTASEHNAQRLLSLVNEILDAEKLSAGKMVMDFAACNLADIANASMESVRGFAEQQDVTLHSSLPSAMVTADSGRLVQAIVNLLSNAVKFSPKGGTVSALIEPGPKFVLLKIQDEGQGIPDKFRDQVFGRFQQLKSHGTLPGSGIGLSICRDIVRAHKGEVGFDSTEGKGTTFWIKLPAAQSG